MAVERIIGIDFGTSTSVIRVKRYKDGAPVERLETKEVLFNNTDTMVPTRINQNEQDPSKCYFGKEARPNRKGYSYFHSFKMDLENPDPDIQARAKHLTEVFFRFMAEQYRSQSDDGHLGEPSDKERTVVSYPVKWSRETKNFMLETAQKAGFPNVTGMDEAQAAIQAVTVMRADHLQKHGLLKKGVPANILLIDMGAGTTDLVLASYIPGSKTLIDVQNTWPRQGTLNFGGREIDALLQNFFREKLDAADARQVFHRIGTDKFKTWKELNVSSALARGECVREFDALDSYVEDNDIEMEPYCLDRAALENCLGDYLKQFPGLIRGCLADAGVSGSEVDLVIVTGGHGQWYFVREMLLGNMPQFGTIDFPKLREEPARIVTISRPQETVALGLAYSPIHMDWAVDAADVPSGPKQVRKDFEKTSVSLNGQKESTNAAQQELQERIRQMQIKQEEERQRQLQLQKEREERARMEQARRQQEAAEQRRKAQQDASHNYEALKRVPYTPETEFELASSNGCYWIKKYVGTSSVVSIPPMIRGRKVVAIGACAFGGPTIVQGNKSLEAVVIPDTVRSIGMRAFTGCFRLHTLIAHSAIEEIGESAFWGCDKLTKLDFGTGEMPAGHVRFPRSLKKIGPRAFTKAVSLTGETYLKEVLLSKRTVVKNGIGEKTFNENCCAVFYYD